MYDYEDYAGYYEPSLADEVFEEAKNKLKEALHESIKNENQQIRDENFRLKNQNEEYKQRENEISRKERDIKWKEENLKREVEKEFYQNSVGDVLKQFVEDSELWFADQTYILGRKCNLCNEQRKLIATFPNGKTSTTDCECSKKIRKYKPSQTTLTLITFNKRNSRYNSDRNYYLSRSYTPSKNSNYDYAYNEFKITHIVDEFNDDTLKLIESLKYGDKIGFRNKEECKKYCKWLNKPKDNANIDAYDDEDDFDPEFPEVEIDDYSEPEPKKKIK